MDTNIHLIWSKLYLIKSTLTLIVGKPLKVMFITLGGVLKWLKHFFLFSFFSSIYFWIFLLNFEQLMKMTLRMNLTVSHPLMFVMKNMRLLTVTLKMHAGTDNPNPNNKESIIRICNCRKTGWSNLYKGVKHRSYALREQILAFCRKVGA